MEHTFPIRGPRWRSATLLLFFFFVVASGVSVAQSLGDQARALRKAHPSRPTHEITEDELPHQDRMLSSERCHIPERVLETTACEVSLHPERFDGKLVSIRGLVHVSDAGTDLREDGCGGVLVVHAEDIGYRDPQGYRTCHGPTFRRMHQLVMTPVQVTQVRGHFCSPRCTIQPTVDATLIGRVQANPDFGGSGSKRRDFGYYGEYRARVVLFSVREFSELK